MSAVTRMTGVAVAAGLVGLLVAGCSPAAAQQPAAPAPTSTTKPSHSRKPLPEGESRLAGTVASVGTGQLSVTKKDGTSQSVTTDGNTKIVGGPVQQGQRVGVIVKDGHALSVRVMAAKPSATPTPTS